MEDGLIHRLRKAKEELTALKTAHNHGLATAKVFFEHIPVSDYVAEPYCYALLSVKIHFSRDFSPYPYFQFHSNVFENMVYSQNGYELISSAILDSPVENWAFGVYSSSPIESVEHSWSSTSYVYEE